MTSSKDITRIKRSIRSERQLIDKNGEVKKLPKGRRTTTNCYAYILGAMEPQKDITWYIPGFTTGELYEKHNKEDFLNKMKSDFQNLGFSYREVIDFTSLEKGEYLIRVYFQEDPTKEPGFHFIRKSRKHGVWFHKEGWEREPDLVKVEVENYGKKKKQYTYTTSRFSPNAFQDGKDGPLWKAIALFAIKYNG